MNAATQELPRFHRKTDRELRRKNGTFYLHSKNLDMTGLVRWADQEREPVTARTLGAARRNRALLVQFTEDPKVLSYHFWGFRNVSLVEDAWHIFANVEIENGLDVWGPVVFAITQKSQAEVLRLEDAVLQPDPVKKRTTLRRPSCRGTRTTGSTWRPADTLFLTTGK